MDPDEYNNYLIKALNNENNNSIIDTNIEEIYEKKRKIIKKLNLNKKESDLLENKLLNYMYIDNINDIVIGRFIRWINLNSKDNKLKSGGYICDIKINNSINLLLKNKFNKLFEICFNKILLFQLISNQELIILNTLKILDE